MRDFTQRAVEVIRAIPPGRVMTYGQIAANAGSPRGARQVVRILHSMSGKHDLPWHRVINAKGEIGLADLVSRELQIQALESEGVEVTHGGRVDLERYRHEPFTFTDA
ncbi:cysteine methyltransferase [Cohnella sp. CFH 77786]|uniref:MGMT family protein n=1 Tax=Cohnella sp. CFH 77786 TaxID=2662265 RepID=UPI001C60B032|nr:MGMT family protein [Cohnella sp. CFH 77786]MBW5448405.1 cysteine methyltransferase [Cohnella sp. CFH 77786]